MAIIIVGDLPVAIQAHELVTAMLAGANAKAARVAPCLVEPTTTAWQATHAYMVGDKVRLAAGSYIEVTISGTSGASAPTVPAIVSGTVTDGTATWKRIAPTADQLAEAKLTLIGAISRWAEAGSGALQAQAAGPFSMTTDTRQRTGYNLWPSEIEQLQSICGSSRQRAGHVDMFEVTEA